MYSTRLWFRSGGLLLAVLMAASNAIAHPHHWPSQFDKFPPPPPTVDPGPDAATLRLRFVEEATGQPTSATVSINNGNHEPEDDPLRKFSHRRTGNQQQGSIRHRQFSYAFYADGQTTVRVRPGPGAHTNPRLRLRG